MATHAIKFPRNLHHQHHGHRHSRSPVG
jgi:hypothetical protein